MSKSVRESNLNCKPHLVMIIEPETKIRFRYKSEGGSHGGLTGKEKKNGKKTYPTVKLEGYHGKKPVYIRVSLYTEDKEEHVLEFKGKKSEEGIPFIKEYIQKDNTAIFTNIKILSKKKDEICDLLMERKVKKLNGNMSKAVRAHLEKEYSKELKEKAKKIMNSVRLCFEAFEENRPEIRLCEPLFSDLICNLKAASKGDLRIHRMSRVSGTWKGGDEVILLCDKVQKDNIKILFFETDESDEIIWQEEAIFTPADVHYQVAITFKTPKYRQNIEKTVFVCLVRQDEISERRQFTYIGDFEEFCLRNPRKRRRSCTAEDSVTVASPESVTSSMSVCSPGSSSKETSGELSNICQLQQTGKNAIENFDLCNFLESGNINDCEEVSNGASIVQSNICQQTEDVTSFSQLLGSDIDINDIINDAYPLSFESLINVPINSPENVFNQNLDFGYTTTGDSVSMDIGKLEKQMSAINIKEESENELGFSCSSESSVSKNETNKYSHFDFHEKKCICSHFMSKRDDSGNTLLHLAVHKNKNVAVILKMDEIASTNIINVQNYNKETALHIAVKQNNTELVKILLMNGSNPNLKNNEGNNCYHIASQNNFFEIMHLLLTLVKWKPDINAFNYEGLTSLHITVMNNSDDCYHLLKGHSANYNLLEQKSGRSLLHYAVEFQPSFVTLLLGEEEINVNGQDFEGNSPLHVACAAKKIDVVKQLLQAGADPLLKNFKRHSAETFGDFTSDETPADITTNSDEIYGDDIGQIAADLTTSLEILELLKQASNKFSGQEEMIEKLCILLDADMKWKTVATYFVDEKFVNILKFSPSPTKALLAHIKKEHENYIDNLKKVFEITGLDDALEVIKDIQI